MAAEREPGAAWDHGRYCDAVATEIARFAAATEGADPATPVWTCPPWTLAKLLLHVGGVHRWAERTVRELPRERLGRPGNPDLARDPATYPAWLAEGAAPLVATLRAADPDAPVWAWGADQHVRFWPRRMLHETAVHRADAELALGLDPVIDRAIAADGADEFLANLPSAAAFAPNVKNLRGTAGTLRLHATDADAHWLVSLHPEGFTWRRGRGDDLGGGDAAAADVTVGGGAADLLLLLYGRRKPDRDRARYSVSGDQALLGFWLANSPI